MCLMLNLVLETSNLSLRISPLGVYLFMMFFGWVAYMRGEIFEEGLKNYLTYCMYHKNLIVKVSILHNIKRAIYMHALVFSKVFIVIICSGGLFDGGVINNLEF